MGLRDQLAGKIPSGLLPHVSDHFEVIGDVAVLGVPAELEPYKQTLAQAIVSRRKNITTVLARTEKITGESRTAAYEVLLGDTTVTVHREFGFSYRIDVGSSFFSSRMASERKRVTDQVEPGETVYVPFAGVGPYAIPAAARGAEVWAVEKNPDAFRWLGENIALNRVAENCHIREGDALDTSSLPPSVRPAHHPRTLRHGFRARPPAAAPGRWRHGALLHVQNKRAGPRPDRRI